MKIVLAFDSFKHMMSATEICDTISDAVNKELQTVQAVKMPIADGGEGTIDAMLAAAGGKKIYNKVKGPEFSEVEAYYGLLQDGVAVIELAAICGLQMVSAPNPEKTTTFGVGQMIKKALDDGCRKLILCIGGSATNDAGIGAMTALGVVFRDCENNDVIPNGENLVKIAYIDLTKMDVRLKEIEILIACDVTNPLYGENGAAYIFGPQKGADREMVIRLDAGLRHYAEIVKLCTGEDVSQIPGSGAAGGIAASFIAFCSAALRPGIDLVLDTIDFDNKINDADYIFTGEGKTDLQTMSGKAVLGVAKRAKKHGIPVIVISGAVDDYVDEQLYNEGVCAVFSSIRLTKNFDEIKEDSPVWLKRTVVNVLRACLHGKDFT